MDGILAILAGVGAFIAGIGYFMGQYRKGNSDGKKDTLDISKDTMSLLTTQVEALQRIAEESKKEIQRLSHEVVRLQTQLDEKDKKLKEYLDILQGRDPELKTFIKNLSDVATQSAEYMKTSSNTLSRLEDFVEKVEPFMEAMTSRVEHLIPSTTEPIRG